MAIVLAHLNADGRCLRAPVIIGTALLLLAVLGACSGTDSGPMVQCTVQDGAGRMWVARDINPLAAQERALIDCGAQSRSPDSCAAVACDRHW